MTWAEWWNHLRKFALGWLGLDPQRFYHMDIEDFFLMKKGYEEKFIDSNRMILAIGLTLVSPWLKSKPDIDNIWPKKQEKRNTNQMFAISKKNDEWLKLCRQNPNINLNPHFN